MAQKIDDTLDLDFNIEGLGFTSDVKYTHSTQYWTDNTVDPNDSDAKADQIRLEFVSDGATDDGWRVETYGESINKEAGTIGVSVGLVGQSGVGHDYTINFSTNWIDLPDMTASLNGNIHGTGQEPEDRISSSVDYYKNIDFDTIMSGNMPSSGWEDGETYLQSESLNINYKTGDISYDRAYVNYELPYKDTWTVENGQTESEEDSINLNGQIIGLRKSKEARYAAVYSYFESNFASDTAVWSSKVATVMGASTPDQGYIKSRSISYDDVTGSIGYTYNWGVSPASGEIDYQIAGSYERENDEWTFTCNGEVRGSGDNVSTRLNSALQICPHEEEAWNHTYNVFVSKLDDNASTGDVPIIEQIDNSRYLTARSFGADDATGTVTFNFTWSSANTDTYKNISTHEHSWDDSSATETINVNGIIKANSEAQLDSGWASIYNGGDPACPVSIYAARHTNDFLSNTEVEEKLPVQAPISSTRRPSALSFDRKATLISSTYSKKQDENTNQLGYSFVFSYKAWPYGLPLWLKEVAITLNKRKSVDMWARHAIIGKRSGPVHQDMNARSENIFDVSISLSAGKRKTDQFGAYLELLLEEYSEYALRRVFLERSGYSSFNYSKDSGANQNCYLTSDTMDYDVINGRLSRSVSITMLEVQG